jgi:hypothetical protein
MLIYFFNSAKKRQKPHIQNKISFNYLIFFVKVGIGRKKEKAIAVFWMAFMDLSINT